MRSISVEEAREQLSGAAAPQLVDCREEWEVAFCALPGHIHIPLDELSERADELDPARPVLVYCHAGVRSLSACTILLHQGFQAINLRGGIDAWSVRIDPTVPRY